MKEAHGHGARYENDELNADISHRHCDGTKRHDET